MPLIPNTRSAVFYSYTVKANGKQIGTLQRFNPTSTRQVQRLRGIQNNAGKVIEIVPGTTDDSITMDKVKLHRESMLGAFGYTVKSIQDINDTIDIEEIEHHPDGTTTTMTYAGCWISQYSKNTTEGTVLVVESMTVQVTQVR